LNPLFHYCPLLLERLVTQWILFYLFKRRITHDAWHGWCMVAEQTTKRSIGEAMDGEAGVGGAVATPRAFARILRMLPPNLRAKFFVSEFLHEV
jgi:hypothetical protein